MGDFEDFYTRFKAVSPEPLETKSNLYGTITLPKDVQKISTEGNLIFSENTPKVEEFNMDFLDRMASTHSEQQEPSIQRTDLKGAKKRAMDFFKSKGLSAHHAAGIVGNLMGESNLNHEAINTTSGAYGIAQWLGNRKKKLFSRYGNKPTFDQQLEFIWEELNSDENNAYNKLLQTKSVSEAINSFMQHFERPSKREMAESIERRLKYGKELLA